MEVLHFSSTMMKIVELKVNAPIQEIRHIPIQNLIKLNVKQKNKAYVLAKKIELLKFKN